MFNAVDSQRWTLKHKRKDKKHPYHIFGDRGEWLGKHKDYWKAQDALWTARQKAKTLYIK